MHLNEKVNQSIKLLKVFAKSTDEPIEISYSGGKDSDVILQLAKMAGINYRVIYKNTTIDPPGTINHAKKMGAEIIKPRRTFFQIIQEKGIPNRRRRFCCSELKEYAITTHNVMGIRKDESTKRKKRYKEPEECRILNGIHQHSLLPILEWTKDDVAEFIKIQGIKCHTLYYDEEGNFHPERRLGCMGCPLMYRKKRINEFIRYPKMLRLWIKNYQVFLDTHQESKAFSFCKGSAFNGMFQELFTSNKERYELLITGGLFKENAIDAKAFLEDYFKIDLS